MDYKLAKQLKDAGFPFKTKCCVSHNDNYIYEMKDEKYSILPTLSELIEACGRGFQILCCDVYNFESEDEKWFAGEDDCGDNCPRLRQMYEPHGLGKTPEEAVAKLWLELNKSK